jgi:hypothetical protein
MIRILLVKRNKGRPFLVGGGRLVDPYSANSYDMARARDGAVEVETIRITEGPTRVSKVGPKHNIFTVWRL